MNESLFWKEGFPKEQRIELVAELLYTGDSDALRERLKEGLLPDRVKDFYAAALGFTSVEDLDARLEEACVKYQLHTPSAPHVLPVEDPFEKFFASEPTKARATRRKTQGEKPVAVAPEVKANRSRKPRTAVPEQPIVPVPSLRIEPAVEAPMVETVPVPPTSDVRRPIPEVHAEDRVAALARAALAWFGRKPSTAEHTSIGADADKAARTREVVSELLAKEFGTEVFEPVVRRDPKAKANVEAANRLERAIATSAHLEPKARAAMKDRVAILRSTYEGRMEVMARDRGAELQASLDEVVAREQGDESSALRVLATNDGHLTDGVSRFREQVEHTAVQRGGMESVAAIDAAFQNAWREAWKKPTEGSLTRLRLLEGGAKSGVAQMVAAARVSAQETIDQELPTLERAIKRAA